MYVCELIIEKEALKTSARLCQTVYVKDFRNATFRPLEIPQMCLPYFPAAWKLSTGLSVSLISEEAIQPSSYLCKTQKMSLQALSEAQRHFNSLQFCALVTANKRGSGIAFQLCPLNLDWVHLSWEIALGAKPGYGTSYRAVAPE